MGRWSGDGRRTVEQTRVIEIGTLRRAGYVGRLTGGSGATKRLSLALGPPTGETAGSSSQIKPFTRFKSRGVLAASDSIFCVIAGEKLKSYMRFVIDRGAVGIATGSLMQHDRQPRGTGTKLKRRKSESSSAAIQVFSMIFPPSPRECIGSGTNGFGISMIGRKNSSLLGLRLSSTGLRADQFPKHDWQACGVQWRHPS
jgi:hypothetical protein